MQRTPKYEQKEMVLEINGGHDEIMVIELNAQCAIMDKVSRRFQMTFPKTWDMFSKRCLEGKFSLGDVMMNTEDGVHVAILMNNYFRVGANKDDKDVVMSKTLDSIKEMIKITGKDKRFVSGYIGDHMSKDIWGSVVQLIKRENLNWVVYRD